MSQINVVPFIDVMLVLLIIFMITTPMLQQGVEVELPQADAEPLDDEQSRDPLVVTVDAGGAMTLNQGPHVDEPLAAQEITEIIREFLAEHPETPTYVRGDRNVDYGRVVDAMIALQRAGGGRVGLITDPARDNSD